MSSPVTQIVGGRRAEPIGKLRAFRPSTIQILEMLSRDPYRTMSNRELAKIFNYSVRNIGLLKASARGYQAHQLCCSEIAAATNPPPKLGLATYERMDVLLKVDARLTTLDATTKGLWCGVVKDVWRYGDGFAIVYGPRSVSGPADLAARWDADEAMLSRLYDSGLLIETDGGVALPAELKLSPRRPRGGVRASRRPRPARLDAIPRASAEVRILPVAVRPEGEIGGELALAGGDLSGAATKPDPENSESNSENSESTATKKWQFSVEGWNQILPVDSQFDSQNFLPLARTLSLSSTSPGRLNYLENTVFLKRESAPASARETATNEENSLLNAVCANSACANSIPTEPDGTEAPVTPLAGPGANQPVAAEAAPPSAPVAADHPAQGKTLGNGKVLLPDDWEPDAKWLAFAANRVCNVEDMVAMFRFHQRQGAKVSADWQSSFAKWVLNEAKMNPNNVRKPSESQEAGKQSQAAPPASRAAVAAADPAAAAGDVAIWGQACGALKDQIGPGMFAAWIGKLSLGPRDAGGRVTLWAATSHAASFVRNAYEVHIEGAWAKFGPPARFTIACRAP